MGIWAHPAPSALYLLGVAERALRLVQLIPPGVQLLPQLLHLHTLVLQLQPHTHAGDSAAANVFWPHSAPPHSQDDGNKPGHVLQKGFSGSPGGSLLKGLLSPEQEFWEQPLAWAPENKSTQTINLYHGIFLGNKMADLGKWESSTH